MTAWQVNRPLVTDLFAQSSRNVTGCKDSRQCLSVFVSFDPFIVSLISVQSAISGLVKPTVFRPYLSVRSKYYLINLLSGDQLTNEPGKSPETLSVVLPWWNSNQVNLPF